MGWIRQWLSRGGVVIDSGANVGQMVLSLAPLPGVSIHAFEPLDNACDWLLECLTRYPDWSVSVKRFGLSATDGCISLQVDGARSTARTDWYQGKDLPVTQISVMPLDDYLRDENVERVRLWKLDVEGCELEALKGARHSLRQQRIDALLIEVSAVAPVAEFLKACGYRLHLIGPGGLLTQVVDTMTPTGNMVALPVKE